MIRKISYPDHEYICPILNKLTDAPQINIYIFRFK